MPIPPRPDPATPTEATRALIDAALAGTMPPHLIGASPIGEELLAVLAQTGTTD